MCCHYTADSLLDPPSFSRGRTWTTPSLRWRLECALELSVLFVCLIQKSVKHFMFTERWVIPVGGSPSELDLCQPSQQGDFYENWELENACSAKFWAGGGVWGGNMAARIGRAGQNGPGSSRLNTKCSAAYPDLTLKVIWMPLVP